MGDLRRRLGRERGNLNVDWTDLKTLCCFRARCSNGGFLLVSKEKLIEGGGTVGWMPGYKSSYVKRRKVSDN